MERIATRQLDELGRIVLPAGLREDFDWERGTELDIFADTETRQVVLKPALPRCVFCKSEAGLSPFGGRHICEECLKGIHQL